MLMLAFLAFLLPYFFFSCLVVGCFLCLFAPFFLSFIFFFGGGRGGGGKNRGLLLMHFGPGRKTKGSPSFIPFRKPKRMNPTCGCQAEGKQKDIFWTMSFWLNGFYGADMEPFAFMC